MFKKMQSMLTVLRTRQVIFMLLKRHNFDIREDIISIYLVMRMVKGSPYTNEQIVKNFLKMHTFPLRMKVPTEK
jgi:hypothetical protein